MTYETPRELYIKIQEEVSELIDAVLEDSDDDTAQENLQQALDALLKQRKIVEEYYHVS